MKTIDHAEHSATVLVVDDDPGARLLVGTALEMAGFRVFTAVDGAAALSQFGAHPADSGVLDQRVKFLVRSKQTQDQLRESEARVRYLAYYDPLTALPNRQRMLQILEQQVAWAGPQQRGLAVLMLDVDNFSRINDTQGQAVGDVLLKEVAHRLQNCL